MEEIIQALETALRTLQERSISCGRGEVLGDDQVGLGGFEIRCLTSHLDFAGEPMKLAAPISLSARSRRSHRVSNRLASRFELACP